MSYNIPLKLRDWIDPEKLNWFELSKNPAAIQMLEQNPDKIAWWALMENPAAIHLIEKRINIDNIITSKYTLTNLFYNLICINYTELKNFINVLQYQHYAHIYWYYLSKNPAAIHILEKNPDKIDWGMLSANPSPKAISLLEKNPDKICWWSLSENPAAMEMLEQNPDKICWIRLSINPSERAIALLAQNFEMIYPDYFSKNPAPFHILKKHNILDYFMECCSFFETLPQQPDDLTFMFEQEPNKIHKNYFDLSSNPAIFVYDYCAMRAANAALKEEIIRAAWHPRRVLALVESGADVDDL